MTTANRIDDGRRWVWVDMAIFNNAWKKMGPDQVQPNPDCRKFFEPQPGEITITREEFRLLWWKVRDRLLFTTERDDGDIRHHDIELELFGPLPEGQLATATEKT